MIRVTEEIKKLARDSAERIVRSGKRRSEYGSLSIRTEEKQIQNWATGILGEMVFQKEIQEIGLDVGPVNLSVVEGIGGDGGTDFEIVIVDGQIRRLTVPLDVKTTVRGQWLLVPERGFKRRALYALVKVDRDEGKLAGMAFGWMFLDPDNEPYYRIEEGDGLPNSVDASIAYWQGLKRYRTRLTKEGMFPHVYEGQFKVKTTNIGLPEDALIKESHNYAWALEKASE